MKIQIIEKTTGKLLFSTYQDRYTQSYAKLFYKHAMEGQISNFILINNVKINYIYKINDKFLIVIFQKFHANNENNLDLKYLEFFSKIVSNKDSQNPAMFFKEKEILLGFIPQIMANEINVVSDNEQLLNQFFEQINGVEFENYIYSLAPSFNRFNLIKYSGTDFFFPNAKYLKIKYFHNNRKFLQSIRKNILSRLELIIVLKDESIYDNKRCFFLDTIKKSPNLKQALILVHRSSPKYENLIKIYDKNLPVEKFLIEQFNTEKFLNIIQRYFLNYIENQQ